MDACDGHAPFADVPASVEVTVTRFMPSVPSWIFEFHVTVVGFHAVSDWYACTVCAGWVEAVEAVNESSQYSLRSAESICDPDGIAPSGNWISPRSTPVDVVPTGSGQLIDELKFVLGESEEIITLCAQLAG